MGFASLGSGSRGNGTVVALKPESQTRDVVFLVDCGFTLKQTEQRLQRLGLAGGDLDAIFVTHEHSDHMSGVAAVAHKYALPVYASYGTARNASFRCETFDGDVPFTVRDVQVNPVRVPHDAREPTQFVFNDGVEQLGILSDLGTVTAHVVEQFSTCTHLLMEANHDVQMLANGGYPPALKRRVGANYGHLSNDQALALLQKVARQDLHVVIGHVSEQNNREDLLTAMFAGVAEELASLQIATQQEGFTWLGREPLSRQASFSALGQL